MATSEYRFEFAPGVPLHEAERTLHLTLYAIEGLYGRARVRLEVRFEREDERRAITVRTVSEVGETVARILTSLLSYEFGDASFSVGHVRPVPRARAGAVA